MNSSISSNRSSGIKNRREERLAKTIEAHQLGINLANKDECELFHWFLACLLFGKPIQRHIAKNAYQNLVNHGIATIDDLAKADWDSLVELLDQAHYVRYDFSTATKLIEIAQNLKQCYGSVLNLVKGARDSYDLENRLLGFKGIGPVTAEIFMRNIRPVWFAN